MKLAILDDYQRRALGAADWSVLKGVEVTVFDQALASVDEAAAKLAPFEILCLMRERTAFPRALIERLPKLRFMSLTGARAGSLDLGACRERGVTVSHTGAGNGSASTAELTWGLIVSAQRGLGAAERNMREGRWHEGLPRGIALKGLRLGLLGLGRMGAAVAAVGRAFGMDVVAWSQNLTPEKAAPCGATCVGKEELLGTADVVSIHLVLSERTRGLVGAREIALMKPGALLVNVSRGPIVDEAALLEALGAGRIRAALDVYEREPLPAGHPLRASPGVTLSPHLGYVNEENWRTFYGDTVENVAAWMAGSPIRVLQ